MKHIALLRAVNVGGTGAVGMTDLRALLEESGYRDVATYIQSGNLVLSSDRLKAAALEEDLEKRVADKMGVQTVFLVRTPAEWGRAIAVNPFPKEAKNDPSHLLLLPLRDKPSAAAVAALRAAVVDQESLEVLGREAYVYYPDGIGRSKLTLAAIEKHLKTRATMRNWNTVLKLAAMAS